MSTSLKRLINGELLTAGVTTGYESPSSVTTRVLKYTATNRSSSEAEITVYLVPSGGSASDDNVVCRMKKIPAGETHSLHAVEGHVIEAGGTLRHFANELNAISVVSSGTQTSV